MSISISLHVAGRAFAALLLAFVAQGSIARAQLTPVQSSVNSRNLQSFDVGRVSGDESMGRMLWVMKRSQAQEDALQALLAAQQDPESPSYHQWLSSEEYSERFGASENDLAELSEYLNKHGLPIAKVHRGLGAVEFSGTASRVQAALHAEVHAYRLPNGRILHGLTTPPKVDASVASFTSLVVTNGAAQGSTNVPRRKVVYNAHAHRFSLQRSRNGMASAYQSTANAYDPDPGFFGVTPGDLGVLYDIPYYGKGSSLKGMYGTGVTVGVVGDSNVNLSYIANYRSTFGLPANAPAVVVDGTDPGITDNALSAYSQIELVSAIAPNARITYYTAASTDLDNGVDFALLRAITDNKVKVLLFGIQGCEAYLGDSNSLYSILFQAAAAQGMSVITATGNSGSASCDNPTDTAASSGLAVNGYASTPYAVAVGGTDFYYGASQSADDTTYAQYWGTTANQYVNLLKYVPEQPWNDAFGLNQAPYPASNFATGGGLSSVGNVPENLDSNGNLISYGTPGPYPQPVWQQGVVPASISSSARALPDVAFFSGDGYNNSAYVFCAEAQDCSNPSQTSSTLTFTASGGTQDAAAVFAGIMAVFVQQHGLQGNPNPFLYSAFVTKPAAFHAISQGSNTVACAAGSPNCSSGQLAATSGGIAYPATGGYSAATGLGSVDGAALIATSPKARTPVVVNFTITNPTTGARITSFSHGDPVRINISVSGSGGTPTGDVTILDSSPLSANDTRGVATLSNGKATFNNNDFPGGTYQVSVRYGGDQAYALGVSSPTTITVSGVPSNFNIESQFPANGGSVSYGTPVSVSLAIFDQGKSAASPTGFITLKDGATTIATLPLDGGGYASFKSSKFAVGSHSLTASYSGDPGYNPSTLTSGLSFTVTAMATRSTLSTSASGIVAANGATQLTATVAPSTAGSVGTAPGGTVTIYSASNVAIAQNVPLTGGVNDGVPTGIASVSLTGSQIGTGTVALHATYVPASGSPYQASSSSPVSVNVGGAASNATTSTLATSDGATTYFNFASQIVFSGKVSGGATPTGTVTLSSNGAVLATGIPLASGSWTYTLGYSNTTGLLPLSLGPDVVIASYSGDSTHATSSAALRLSILSDTTAADFVLQTAVNSLTLTSSAPSGSFSLLFTSRNGFAGTITPSYSAPSGITCSSSGTVTLLVDGSAALTVTCSESGVAVGTYPVAISAAGTFASGLGPNTTNSLTHSAQLTVSVQ